MHTFVFHACRAVLALALVASQASSKASAQDSRRFSGPYTKGNLSIFLVHGANLFSTNEIYTLDEAIAHKAIVVHETGSVNKLAVENTDPSHLVFIQAGDIVKGGRQDRVLGRDLILKPLSGKVSIDAYCVEHSRWSKRGNENSAQFEASANRINSRKMKRSVLAEKNQSNVWREVENVQEKLGLSVGKSVKSSESASSLQLSLEDQTVRQEAGTIETELLKVLDGKQDVVGYAFVVNGQLNSAEVYASNDLFKRLWQRLLHATVLEAIAERGIVHTPKTPSEADVAAFLKSAESAPIDQKSSFYEPSTVEVRQSKDSLFYESREAANKPWLHRSYLNTSE